MKILVAITQVGVLQGDPEIEANGRAINFDSVDWVLNEWDQFSVEEAVRIKEAGLGEVEVIVVCIGPERADQALRECLAKGADRAIRVWDVAIEGSDAGPIARLLAGVAKEEGADMLFAGAQAADYASAATGVAAAGVLGWPHAAMVTSVDYVPGRRTATVRRELEGGLLHELEIDCPAVLTIQLGINVPRYASLRAIKQAAGKPLQVRTLTDCRLSPAGVGEQASLARVRKVYIPDRGAAEMIEGTAAEQAVRIAQIIRQARGIES